MTNRERNPADLKWSDGRTGAPTCKNLEGIYRKFLDTSVSRPSGEVDVLGLTVAQFFIGDLELEDEYFWTDVEKDILFLIKNPFEINNFGYGKRNAIYSLNGEMRCGKASRGRVIDRREITEDDAESVKHEFERLEKGLDLTQLPRIPSNWD